MGDSPAQATRASALMARLESSAERAELLETVIAEAVWTLESFYQVPRPEIAEKLAAILRFPGIKARAKGTLISALARFSSTTADFVDCLLAARSLHGKLPIYSFDAKDFRRLGASWELPP